MLFLNQSLRTESDSSKKTWGSNLSGFWQSLHIKRVTVQMPGSHKYADLRAEVDRIRCHLQAQWHIRIFATLPLCAIRIPRGGYGDEARPIMEVYRGKPRDKAHRFKQRRFQLDIKEKQFRIRTVEHRKKGPERCGSLHSCRFSRPHQKKPRAS